MKPKIITAHYKIVTPMFIGGANQTPEDGVRPPSAKGALRFWWRALNWGEIRSNKGNDEDALKELHQQEAFLFGSANDNDRKVGQGKFLLRTILSNQKIERPKLAGLGLQYLLGQGLCDSRQGGKILRDAISKGDLKIQCVLHPSITQTQKEQLEQALLIFGLLGGLGSRARKGFGSVAISYINSEKYPAPRNKEELLSTLKQLKQNVLTVTKPPFTAFSNLSRIDLSLSGSNGLDLLGIAGEQQQLYRSWGHRNYKGQHVVGSERAEQNFKQSHDLMQDVGDRIRPNTMPNKAVFGLPQNYFFSSTKADIQFTLNESNRSRRASPLLIHVHQLPNEAILIQTLLPAVFLNPNEKLIFKRAKSPIAFDLNYDETMTDWKIIERYLDRSAFIMGDTV